MVIRLGQRKSSARLMAAAAVAASVAGAVAVATAGEEEEESSVGVREPRQGYLTPGCGRRGTGTGPQWS